LVSFGLNRLTVLKRDPIAAEKRLMSRADELAKVRKSGVLSEEGFDAETRDG
jgi:hypothetical protein